MTRRGRARWVHGVAAFVLIPAAVFAAVWWLNVAGVLFPLQGLTYDWMISRQASPDIDASPVVIVGIDDRDIHETFAQYPVGDAQMVDLLSTINDAGARTIGIDLYRDIPTATHDRPTHSAEDYKHFNDYLLAHGNIVNVERLGDFKDDPNQILPPAGLVNGDPNQQAGASSFVFDADGRIRRAVPFWDDPRTGDNVPSLGTLLALKYLSAENTDLQPADNDESALLLGHARLTRPRFPAGFYARPLVSDQEAAGETYEWMVDFRAPETLRLLTVRDVTKKDPATLALLKDKIVIIGVTAKSVKDLVATPFSPVTYGFFMHGYIADQIVRWAKRGERPPAFAGRPTEIGWTFAWALLGAATGGLGVARSLLKVGLLFTLELLVLTAAAMWLLRFGTIMPFVAPLLCLGGAMLGALAYMSAIDREDRRIVQQLINMHISRPVAEQLLEDREQFFASGKLAPQRMIATVLFSDLMNFTPIAEKLDSADLMAWLNDFFEQMTRVVEECGGVVNKFNGDMVMALFGPPRVRTKDEEIAADARAAVRCAVLMRQELAKLNVRWTAQGLPTPLMRIGIHTGPLVAGSLGGKNRVEYTVIGDTVNTASRLESSNKECMDEAIDGTRIIVGQATCDAIAGHYRVKSLGSWELKGKEATPVHAVLEALQTANPGVL